MSRLYLTAGNGFMYTNIKDVNEFPALRDRIKEVEVFNPKANEKQKKNRFETNFIEGTLKSVFLGEYEYSKCGQIFAVTLEGSDGVEYNFQTEPFWGITAKNGDVYSNITNSLFRSLVEGLSTVKIGDYISIAINDKVVSKDKNKVEKTTKDGNPIYSDFMIVNINVNGQWQSVPRFERPTFQPAISQGAKNIMTGKASVVRDGGKELLYYFDIIKNIRSTYNGAPAMPQQVQQPVAQVPVQTPVTRAMPANVAQGAPIMPEDDDDDLPF